MGACCSKTVLLGTFILLFVDYLGFHHIFMDIRLSSLNVDITKMAVT